MKAAYPNLLPELSAAEFDALKADIAKRGVMVPIEIDADTGDIVDGFHRYQACKQLGITVIPQKQRHFKSEAERCWHAVALNIHRRQLPKSRVAAFAAKYRLPMAEEKAKERRERTRKKGSEKPVSAKVRERENEQPARAKNENGKAAEEVAAEVGVSPRMIEDAKKVMNDAPEIFEKVLSGDVTLSQAKQDISVPLQDASEWDNQAIRKLQGWLRKELKRWPDDRRADAAHWIRQVLKEFNL